jgi:hypothetical protein
MRERSTANAIANFVYNGFGYLPAPYLYGIVAEQTKKLDKHGNNISRYGMVMLLYSSIIGVMSLAIAICLNRSSRRKAAKMANDTYGGQFTKERIEELLEEIDEENKTSGSKDSIYLDNNLKLKEAIEHKVRRNSLRHPQNKGLLDMSNNDASPVMQFVDNQSEGNTFPPPNPYPPYGNNKPPKKNRRSMFRSVGDHEKKDIEQLLVEREMLKN